MEVETLQRSKAHTAREPGSGTFREGGRRVATIQYDRERESRTILLSLVKSIQERDIITYEHSRRVATYAQRLARYLGWSRREAYDLALAALVHDLGKTWIANDILNKSESLSNDERRTMERHPAIGAGILIGCDVHPFYVETVLCHHETWDGRGYPTGLHGEEIPLSARILSVADVYDALTSQRPYKEALSDEAARECLLRGASTNFDPTVVVAFLHLLETFPNFRLAQRVCALPKINLPGQRSLLAGI
jgi:HD-GYP domain-containing protein (c-di-GMP phosphodiesterase class II)